jgi:transposase
MAQPVRARRLTDEEGRRLQQIVRRGKHGSIRVRRAMIIMASASGTRVPAIARLVAADEDTVRDVIHAFNAKGLAALDPRWAGGRPRLISDGDVDVIVAAATTRPETLGLPFTHWSLRKLAADTSHRDLSDQPGKARPGICRRGRYPQVVVDHHDPRPRPAQRRCALGQRVLQPRRFGMLKNLLPAGLAYTTAARSRCSARIFSCDWPHGRYLSRLIAPASRRAGRGPGRQHRQQRHRRGPPFRRQRHPDPQVGSHRSPAARSHLAHLPQASAEPPWPPPATALPRSVSPQVQASRWRTL